ncbi:MAG: hypothetical protein HYY93_03895 [Planctomycetes bacterium]|nr:hypothetical protein [Planctomycetota bacterium]
MKKSNRRTPDEQIEELAKTLWESPYSDYVRGLLKEIQGKVVASSIAGQKGYLLGFGDGSWVACYFANRRMQWRVGAEEPARPELRLIGGRPRGQTTRRARPKSGPSPYSMESELASAHGWPVTNLTIGVKSFSLCFPRGMQLQPKIRATPSGGKALRVYWERW